VRGVVAQGDSVTVKVDYDRRTLIAPNHTCTHVLNHALLATLGGDIAQKGSLVDDEKLRFDFSFGKPVPPESLAAIEAAVQKVHALTLCACPSVCKCCV
jgi:alanyl-tRNA synthetase